MVPAARGLTRKREAASSASERPSVMPFRSGGLPSLCPGGPSRRGGDGNQDAARVVGRRPERDAGQLTWQVDCRFHWPPRSAIAGVPASRRRDLRPRRRRHQRREALVAAERPTSYASSNDGQQHAMAPQPARGRRASHPPHRSHVPERHRRHGRTIDRGIRARAESAAEPANATPQTRPTARTIASLVPRQGPVGHRCPQPVRNQTRRTAEASQATPDKEQSWTSPRRKTRQPA